MVIRSLICGLLLVSCESPGIKDDVLNDRVKACGAGFSVGAQADLHASLNKAALSGEIGADAKEETKSIIFTEVPADQFHIVYEDYIACVEKNWNENK